MTATILNGRKIAQQVNALTVQRINSLKQKNVIPSLVVIILGQDPASARYVRNKHRKATQLGIRSIVKHLSEHTTQDELLHLIQSYNHDDSIHAILVQAPLPQQIDKKVIDNAIDPRKDVDGFHPLNMGKLFSNDDGGYPVACTPRGIMTIFHEYQIDLTGKRVVVIGRSAIVGRPMTALLINANATVSVLNHYTTSIDEYTKDADIIISAVGKLNVINSSNIKSGAVLIDVGQNLNADGKLVGDIDYQDVLDRAGAITPVPGGVGPMTIATLMQQTVDLADWSTTNGR